MAETFTCDGCGATPNEPSPYPGYWLSLQAHKRPHGEGPVYDVYVLPPIDAAKHFCGLGCLEKWLEECP